MTKKFGTLLTVLIVCLMGAVGYLTYETTLLKDRLQLSIQTNQSALATSDQTSLADLQDQLNQNKQLVDKVVSVVDQLAGQVDEVVNQKYLPAPEYSVETPLFSVQENNNTLQVQGHTQQIARWLDSNEFFLEAVLKKVLTLDYDRNRGAVVVTEVVPGSVFYQMGLRQGDAILTVNGRAMSKGAELRNSLIDLEPKKVAIVRDRQRLTLDIAYTDAVVDQDILLKLTQQEFKTSLPELLSTLSLKPAVDQGAVVGVQLGQLTEGSPFAAMQLKSNDVITKINGQPATQEKFAMLFDTESDSVEIEYVRDGVAGIVTVGFSGK